jgi:hypothetical protein
VRTDTRGNALRQAVFVHVAAPGEPTSYTWSFSQALTAVGTIAAYSGVDTANPINAHNGQATASSTTITAPSVTTNVANAELVAFFGITGKTGLTPPSGMTEQREVSTPNGVGTKVTGALADALRLPSGATGSRVATAVDAGANIGQLVALRPSNGPPPPNSQPTASPANVTTAQNTAVAITLSGTDVETCQLTFAIVSGPSHGTLGSIANQSCVAGSPNADTALVTYTPTTGYSGPDSFTYRVSDGDLFSTSATATITVNPPPPAQITLRSSAGGANTSTASLILPKPAGTVTGDVLLAAVTVRGTPTITPPSGWTVVRTDTRGTALRQAVFMRVAAAGEPTSYTWTFSQAATAVGTIGAYTGVDTANPLNGNSGQTTASSATITAPSITTTVANTRLVAFFGITGKTTIGPPSGMLERQDLTSPPSTPDKMTAELADVLRAAVGATGSRVATAAKSGGNIGQLVALRPAL